MLERRREPEWRHYPGAREQCAWRASRAESGGFGLRPSALGARGPKLGSPLLPCPFALHLGAQGGAPPAESLQASIWGQAFLLVTEPNLFMK